MDLKKVAIIKPARGNYDAGTTYAYHSEWDECITGVLGEAGEGALVGIGVGAAGLAGIGALKLLTLSGPKGWAIAGGVLALGGLVGGVVGGLSGYADHC